MARYDDEFRAMAIVMLEADGYPESKGALVRTAKTLKIPHPTLSRWYRQKSNPPPNKLVQIKKEQIIDLLKGEIHAALHEMVNARPDADYKELATTIGILVDKLQLLEGEPTSRTEVIHELSNEERVSRITTIFDDARARRDRRAAGDELIQ